MKKTVPEIISGLETIEYIPQTKKEMEQQYRKLMELTILHISSSKWGLAYCIMFSSTMHRSLEKSHIEDYESLLLTLMSGLPYERTSESIKELDILSKKFWQEEFVNAMLSKDMPSYEEYRRNLVENPHGLQFVEGFESILHRYGHRRLARDLIEPSWSDEPMIPFNMLRNEILRHRQRHQVARSNMNIKNRQESLKEILKAIPIYKRRRFKINSNYLIRYLAFRELQRFYLDMIFSRMRVLFLNIGELMARESIIERKHDVFFLTIYEIEEYLKGVSRDLRYTAAFRRMTFRESCEKPGLYLRNKVDFNEIASPGTWLFDGSVIRGEPVSTGTCKGKVKVIENIDSSSLISPGHILVTKSIDPGQTQVFTSAGGLILEVGGVLSHGAILAREFGIPTVAQINRATKIFSDGQEVVVNGTRGEIVFVERSQ